VARGPKYWLFKSEPETFSLDHLERDGRTEWSGVRNYQARNHMRAMKVGDLGFFYHSNTQTPGIAGVCKVVAAAHPDSTQFDPESDYYDEKSPRDEPRWWCVDVGFVRRFSRLLPLDELRTVRKLEGMLLLRKGQRLSVLPVTAAEWKAIEKLAG
jgi:predicted RNA-binding protein with PUA-like domain